MTYHSPSAERRCMRSCWTGSSSGSSLAGASSASSAAGASSASSAGSSASASSTGASALSSSAGASSSGSSASSSASSAAVSSAATSSPAAWPVGAEAEKERVSSTSSKDSSGVEVVSLIGGNLPSWLRWTGRSQGC